ncbi:MAG: UDP-4-amino-4,6-dideoxy-N-acetyl-beta-L-altrosamine transaminase [Dethiobacter sp.]|jgi:UDP-4-amino-4,6-dideoxy-N-acetyl-beta-L-altrosamine transaminase|nr:UDP-4-amino-4,6-dideoxy-N-acetyl-beta-L-altrosamine transaminase [Dethiobacter sp.]
MSTKRKLAIHGGKPVRENYLQYGRQWLDEKDIQAVADVMRGDYLTTGPTIATFERETAKYVGARHAVAFANGTAALHGACFAAGIGEKDEVITSPLTFAASANCILYQGGTPVFADINVQTYNIEPHAVDALITEKTKAIIPVDFSGLPADIDAIKKIAQKYNLIVIEDAAHALGATYKGKKVGSLADMTMFSFHPVKHITTGEGGVITTNNEGYYHTLLQFRNHGIIKDANKLINNHGLWYYEMQSLGYNYRITDIQAALGISQLIKLSHFIKIRQDYAEYYNSAFRDIEEITCPAETLNLFSSRHLYIIRLNLEKLTAGRKEIFHALVKENIGVNVHYIPVYYHPYYQKLGYSKGLCPNAEKVYEEIITLPLFPAMSRQDLDDVICAVKKVVSHYCKKR